MGTVRVSRLLKEELAWPADKQLNISYSYAAKELKNKAILNLNNIMCVAMWS